MLRATPALMLIAASALILQAESKAVTLFEPFTDGDLIAGSDNSGIKWYRRSNNQAIAIVNDSAGIGTGNALQLSITNNGQINRAVIGTFGLMSLVNIGDQISLTFDFRFEIAPTVSTADGFRFGLYNSAGTPVTADGSTSSDDDRGYLVSIGTGSTLGFDIFKETNSGAGGLGSNEPVTDDRTSIGPTVANTFAISDTSKHTATFTLTRNATGVSFAAYVDGTLLGTGSNNATPFLQFDEVVFNHATPQAYRIDNVKVTTEAVPEPATTGLLGLGLAGLLSRRRRK